LVAAATLGVRTAHLATANRRIRDRLSTGPGCIKNCTVSRDEALAELADLDERKSRVLELRYFAGLSKVEIAEFLGVSAVDGDWKMAHAWLKNRWS
jgi:hypothetical protein